jgi:hypothetical protein
MPGTKMNVGGTVSQSVYQRQPDSRAVPSDSRLATILRSRFARASARHGATAADTDNATRERDRTHLQPYRFALRNSLRNFTWGSH